MGSSGREGLARVLRHALTSVALFAQAMLLVSPLLEFQHSDVAPRAIGVGISTPDAATLSPSRGHQEQHNPTTCPACIAQSLHAQLSAPVRLPTNVVAEQAPFDLRLVVLPHHDPPSTHHSRAPPALS